MMLALWVVATRPLRRGGCSRVLRRCFVRGMAGVGVGVGVSTMGGVDAGVFLAWHSLRLVARHVARVFVDA